ncbi:MULTISPECIES: GbsR/MarR family transcriptional regulator [Actinoalloteichus]|uniref:Transcriptional regulator n=1 Tax=Actinoalloteichus fjordicus TaxID=1612552 RepID=A0AAC9PT21_9PSEU|nr:MULTISPECIES: MarR family transcriptional regulator [Actinoalloteichus]APU15411.1 putative transcriptional regulator [Actinoalloteichus fjordicus]APU21479.1 putative transcriptional regulator [Actinoalloteichus sp. GBA129-24]
MTRRRAADHGAARLDGDVVADRGNEELPDEAARRHADRLAGLLDAAGFPRMPARTLMALLTSPSGELTAEQISKTLDVSPAAVSGAIRYLQSTHLVHTGSLRGTRRRVYSLAPNWYTATLTRSSMYGELRELARASPPSLRPDTAAGQRVEEMADFYAFLNRKFPELLTEWNELRAQGGTHREPPEA